MNRGKIEEAVAVLNDTLSEDRDELAEAFRKLAKFIPEYTPEEVQKDSEASGWKVGTVPFFTEGFLYPLMGKDDARSILWLVRNIQQVLYGEDFWEQDFAI